MMSSMTAANYRLPNGNLVRVSFLGRHAPRATKVRLADGVWVSAVLSSAVGS